MAEYSFRYVCIGEFLRPVLLWKVWSCEIGPLPRIWTGLWVRFAITENYLLPISSNTISFETISFLLPTVWAVTLGLLIKTLNVSTFTRQQHFQTLSRDPRCDLMCYKMVAFKLHSVGRIEYVDLTLKSPSTSYSNKSTFCCERDFVDVITSQLMFTWWRV